MTTVHVPILVEPIIRALIEPFRALPSGAGPHWWVDCTLGGGGHTAAILKALAADPKTVIHRVLAIDRDIEAVQAARDRFAAEIGSGRLVVEHCRVSELDELIAGRPVLALLADLGFSSDQLEDPERGISFRSEGPLDMRLDPSRGISCAELLVKITERELEKILTEYGEERFAKRIAQGIIQARRRGELPRTTSELSRVVVGAIPPGARHGRIHAATRTFQALRIAVNEELDELDQLLSRVILSVMPGGRVAVISFHSLEDRKVKQAFKFGNRGESEAFRALTKKPVEADDAEMGANPRARSAKLRIAERLPTGRGATG